jgi:hypothetical protein
VFFPPLPVTPPDDTVVFGVPPLAMTDPPVPTEVVAPAAPPELFALPPVPDRGEEVAPPEPVTPPDAEVRPPEPVASDGDPDFPQPSTSSAMAISARIVLGGVVQMVD